MSIHYDIELPFITKKYDLGDKISNDISIDDINEILCIFKLNKIHIRKIINDSDICVINDCYSNVFNTKEKLALIQFAKVFLDYDFKKVPKFLDVFNNTKVYIEKIVYRDYIRIKNGSYIININCRIIDEDDNDIPNFSLYKPWKLELLCFSKNKHSYIIHINP